MADYFTSSNISVFPSAYRTTDTKGKYNSEYNFVNIINSIVDKDCYVLSTEESLDEDHTLRVVLHGYYFEIASFTKPSGNLWLAIKTEKNYGNALVNFDSTAVDHTALDSGSNFMGLRQSTSAISAVVDTDYSIYSLQVVENGSLINQVRLSSDSVFYGSDEDETVSDKLDSKQDNLSAGNGITINNNTVSLTDSYNSSLSTIAGKTVGTLSKPVYISNGAATAITGSSGKAYTSGSSGNTAYTYTQAALVTDGALQSTGVQLFASIGDPVDGVGKNGDFWFKYTTTVS